MPKKRSPNDIREERISGNMRYLQWLIRGCRSCSISRLASKGAKRTRKRAEAGSNPVVVWVGVGFNQDE